MNKNIQTQATSLSLTSKQGWMEISLRTASQQWTAHVLHPGPFTTHVSVTWEESSYLTYYENGTLVTEVPATMNERPGYPYTSLSVFVDLPYLWLHQMKLYNQALTSLNAYDEYALSKFFLISIHCSKFSTGGLLVAGKFVGLYLLWSRL